MARRLLILLAALVAVNTAALALPRPTRALSAWFEKGKSDCGSIDAAITLTYARDDSSSGEHRDFFKLEIYDGATGKLLAHIEESITQQQSPFYWQTGRIPAAPYFDPAGKDKEGQGLYRIEMWDTDAKGKKTGLIDQAFLQCFSGNSWRSNPVPLDEEKREIPLITCFSRTPIYSTNGAPEKGAVIFQWTYGTERTELEYHLQTVPVERGYTFDGIEIETPCSTYLRLYFQPDSTKILYYMPSQYWPHDLYGTADHDFEVGPIYHTFFPLDGPTRADLTATPTPSPTPTPTLTPTP